MSAVLACGRWSAVVRLGLAPRWHKLARYLLGIIRTQNGWDVAKNRAAGAIDSLGGFVTEGKTGWLPEALSDTLCGLDGLRGLPENDAFNAQPTRSGARAVCALC
jgi:hypothetical protein